MDWALVVCPVLSEGSTAPQTPRDGGAPAGGAQQEAALLAGVRAAG